MDMPLRLLIAYQHEIAPQPEWIVQAPGREMWVAAAVPQSHQFHIQAPDLDARTSFDRRSAMNKRTLTNRPLPRWSRYLAGVVVALADAGLKLPGVQAIILGDEPQGPRYDYAMALAFAAFWREYNQFSVQAADLLELVEQVRRHYVET